MTSTEYYRTHNTMIEKQSQTRLASRLGALVSGHKKDVVLTNRLITHPGQIAIYGWHRAKATPIQPLSTVHGAGYADYSHGIRLVSEDSDDRWQAAVGLRHSSRSVLAALSAMKDQSGWRPRLSTRSSDFFSVLQQRKLR